MGLLRREIEQLRKHVIIVCFVSPLAPHIRHDTWVRELESKSENSISLLRIAGAGFYFLKLDSQDATNRVLRMTPCRLTVGTALLQPWIPAFNPCKPVGLPIPTWISLHNLPEEYVRMARRVADSVGHVIETDNTGAPHTAPRFCVILSPEQPRVPTLDIASIDGSFVEVAIHYEASRQVSTFHTPSANWRSPHQEFRPGAPYHTRSPNMGRHQHNSRAGTPEDRTRRQPDADGFYLVERRHRTSPTPRPRHRRSHRGGRGLRERRTLFPDGPIDMDVEFPPLGIRSSHAPASGSNSSPPHIAQCNFKAPEATLDRHLPANIHLTVPPLAPPMQPSDNPLNICGLTSQELELEFGNEDMEIERIAPSLNAS